MNDFDRKKEIALNLLRKTNIKERNYLPPMFPFLWRFGVQVPPPHFIGLLPLILIMGLPFGFCGLGFYMMDLGNKPFSPSAAIALVCAITLFLGAGFGFYYRGSARARRLPSWKTL
ncbi:hypothetical protein JOD97_001687 [Duganella sp. 1411]|uniref:DUF6404 family protein n=1 Tax=Duganella sp. 1411 TaxID=2806572 RepID=UPI001AE91C23|nr:hypothetical protein [Duganella sp. 1411]